MMVTGAEKLRILGSKRAMMVDWGKRCVKYSREMCVWKGASRMICHVSWIQQGSCDAHLRQVVVDPDRAGLAQGGPV
jgi:hypothetical protein